MNVIMISDNEAGQRLDKLLCKYLNEASMGFIFKMLRKKNITLNGKRADGSEHLQKGDEVKLFLSEETINKFSKSKVSSINSEYTLDIIYEDEHILLVNKPAGMLSQKSTPEDVSVNEYCIDYMIKKGILTHEMLLTFKPAVCNRLDRNTSGIMVFGKTLHALQIMSDALKSRSLHKYYLCIVNGIVAESKLISGFLEKDNALNKVKISTANLNDAVRIETAYKPLSIYQDRTMLEVELITGKSHQIRAHLASIGHFIIGDYKYGEKNINDKYRKTYGVSSQLLHSHKLIMPELTGGFSYLSGRVFIAEVPHIFYEVMGEQ